jgi:hypothetical protein
MKHIFYYYLVSNRRQYASINFFRNETSQLTLIPQHRTRTRTRTHINTQTQTQTHTKDTHSMQTRHREAVQISFTSSNPKIMKNKFKRYR